MDEPESSTSSNQKKMEAKNKGPLEDESDKPLIIFEDTIGNKDGFAVDHPIGTCTVINRPVYVGVRLPHAHNIFGAIDVPDASVSIKYVNLEEDPEAVLRLRDLAERTNDLLVSPHRNILGLRNSFANKGNYIVVFPFMEEGSLRSIMAARYPNGLPELCILISLKESLLALSYIHRREHLHREINAGHIFLNAKREIKLSYAASVYEHATDQDPEAAAAEDPYLPAVSISNWAAAPEVHGSPNNLYTAKCDVWLVGITALELAYGGLKIENRAALNSMVEKINEKKRLPEKEVQEEVGPGSSSFSFGRLLSFKKRDFSKKFGRMVAKCLNPDPDGRPTVAVLLRSKIFRKLNKGPGHFYDLIKN